ncbi:nSTAND1 domain-containing NTPase [Streptomyces pseudogriseolus]|uniref:nSTAND1 domain-containing NTPase n=1 Tax=Streptomyces pseudogriseolus TaxID=36817 RepID=UPI003FA2AA29
MNRDTTAALVQVLAPHEDGSRGRPVAGAGFLAGDNVVLTGAHVVRAAGQRPGDAVELAFPHLPGAPRTRGWVLAEGWRAPQVQDVAVIRLDDVPPGARPLPLGAAEGSRGHAVSCFGFPAQAPRDGHYGYAVCGDVLPSGLLQLTDANDLTSGFSGAPVVDERTGLVVGMLSAFSPPDAHLRGLDIAYATTAEVLRQVWPELAERDVSPYRGLEPFTAADTAWFHGRDAAVGEVLAGLRAHRRVLLLGPSGSGKSSLVQAGVLPALAAGGTPGLPGGDRWLTVYARPGADLLGELDHAGLPGAADDGLLPAIRRRLDRTDGPGHPRLLLVIDQFEEFLTRSQQDRGPAAKVLDQLVAAAEASATVSLILVMRDDFYPRLAASAPALLEAMRPGMVDVPATLSESELRAIISGPAAAAGARLDEGLLERIITDLLAADPAGPVSRRAPATVLSLLEVTLTQLWEHRRHGTLTHGSYERIGEVTGSLAAWCDNALVELSDERRPIARRLLTSLVQPGDDLHHIPHARRRVPLDDLRAEATGAASDERGTTTTAGARVTRPAADTGATVTAPHVEAVGSAPLADVTGPVPHVEAAGTAPHADVTGSVPSAEVAGSAPDPEAFDEVLAVLTRRRIISTRAPGGTEGRATAELIHDALIRDWPQLGEWVAADRDFQHWLHRAHGQRQRWERSGQPGDLMSGTDLEGGLAWSRERGLPDDVAAFLAASHRHRQAVHRRARRLNSILAGLLTLALIAAGLALWQRREALDAEAAAVAAQRQAQSRQLAAQSEALLDSDPDLASLLAVQAHTVEPTDEATASLYHAADQGLTRHFTGHDGWVNDVAFSRDGTLLASAGADGTARWWNTSTGKEVRPRSLDEGNMWAVEFSPDGRTLATGGDDGAVLWDAATGERLRTLTRYGMTVSALTFSPDGRTLATGGDGAVQLWNVSTGAQRLTLAGHGTAVQSVDFSPDGLTLATAGYTDAVLWDAVTGERRRTLIGHSDRNTLWSLEFSPTGRTLLSGENGGKVRLWDASTGKVLRTTSTGPETGMLQAVYSPDARLLATVGSEEHTVELWDSSTGTRLRTISGHTGDVLALRFSPDGRTLAAGDEDGDIRLWDTTRGQERRVLTEDDTTVTAVTFSPDGRTLASGLYTGRVRLWDAQAGGPRRTLTGTGTVLSVAFSPDGRTVAAGHGDGSVGLWDVSTGKRLRVLPGEMDARTVAFSPDGTRLAVGHGDSTIRLWDTSAYDEPRVLTGHTAGPTGLEAGVWAVAFSPDGDTLASSGGDGTVRLWDASTGKRRRVLTGHKGAVQSVAFTPKGHRLASAGTDGTMRLWYLSDPGQPRVLTGHAPELRFAAFSPDGRILATAGSKDTLWLWDTSTETERLGLTGTGTDFVEGAFSPDSDTFASVDGGRIRLLNVALPNAAEAKSRICGALHRDFTVGERAQYLDGLDGVPTKPVCSENP